MSCNTSDLYELCITGVVLYYYTALDCTAQTSTELKVSVIHCTLLHLPALHFVHYTALLRHAMNMQRTAGFCHTLHHTAFL